MYGFPTVLQFDDYDSEELLEIADRMLLQDVLVLSQAAAERLRRMFQDWRGSGNGRAVRTILERAKRNQALRPPPREKPSPSPRARAPRLGSGGGCGRSRNRRQQRG